MPNITVRNLTSGSLSVPGGFYTAPLDPFASATFNVDDTDEFLSLPSVASLISGGYLGVTLTSGDALERPLQVWTTATLPAAANTAAGTVVYNSTTRSLYECDGTSWAPLVEGGSFITLAAATAIAANRFVGFNTGGLLAVSPVATERWAGVTTEAIALSNVGRVASSGITSVMPAAAIAIANELVAVPGGYAAPYQAAVVSLGTAVAGVDASDDIAQGNLPATVHVTCAGNETGNTLIVYGDVAGTATKETITLGTAGTYVSTNTFTAIYGLRTTAAAVGTMDVRDGGLVGLLIPQIAALAAARFYGAIVPDVSTASVGHQVSVAAGGANATDCVIYGTDFAGNEQFEVVTMNGATLVTGTLAFRTHTFFLIGADGIAFNAGVTSQYDMSVLADTRNEIRAFATTAQAVAGSTCQCFLIPNNVGLGIGQAPSVFWVGKHTLAGGAASEAETIPGLAATDVIVCVLESVTTPASVLISAARSGANTVTYTFSGDPGASVMHTVVYRP